jgi:hypothetical protein
MIWTTLICGERGENRNLKGSVMATVPTNEQVQEMIFDEIRRSNRPQAPDTIAFQIVQMQLALSSRGVGSEAYGEAVNSLIEAQLLSYKNGSSYVMITESGFARL